MIDFDFSDDIEVKCLFTVWHEYGMAEAYGFGLPGYRKPHVIENYAVLNTRNVLTRWIVALGTRNVLLYRNYYT